MDAVAFKSARWALVGAILLIVIYRNRSMLNRSQFARELGLVLVAYFAYFFVRGMTEGAEAQALSNADRIVSFEQRLGIFWEPTWQSLILAHQPLVNVANWMYMWGHWPLIAVMALWLYTSHLEMYRLYRNAFLISGAIGLMIFAAFPVAPPRLAAVDVVDTVTLYSQSYRVLQPPAFVNQYAAIPSLHFGWNMLVGLAIMTCARAAWVKFIGLLIPPVMFLAVVLTANHYIVDAAAGGLVAGVGLLVARAVTGRRIVELFGNAYR